jgi:hypothetical protein
MLRIGNVTLDCAQPERLAQFWSAALGYTVGFSSPYFVELRSPREGEPRFLLIQVPEPRTVKNRMHVDLETDDREAEIAGLVSLGATRGESHEQAGIQWTVMTDPEGNEFCVAVH